MRATDVVKTYSLNVVLGLAFVTLKT